MSTDNRIIVVFNSKLINILVVNKLRLVSWELTQVLEKQKARTNPGFTD